MLRLRVPACAEARMGDLVCYVEKPVACGLPLAVVLDTCHWPQHLCGKPWHKTHDTCPRLAPQARAPRSLLGACRP